MNILVTGSIGSGKTYYAIKEIIIPALQEGRTVYTNIDFGNEKGFEFFTEYKFSEYLHKDVRGLIISLPFNELKKYLVLDTINDVSGSALRVKKNSVIIIDESQMIFDYLGVNNVDKRIYNLFAYSRHYGLDLVFITQDPQLLNKFILNLCNQFIFIEGKKNVSKFLKNVYFYEVKDNLKSQYNIKKGVLQYDKSIFQLYSSYVSGAIDSVRSLAWLPQGWAKPLFGLALVLFALIYGIINFKRFLFFKSF